MRAKTAAGIICPAAYSTGEKACGKTGNTLAAAKHSRSTQSAKPGPRCSLTVSMVKLLVITLLRIAARETRDCLRPRPRAPGADTSVALRSRTEKGRSNDPSSGWFPTAAGSQLRAGVHQECRGTVPAECCGRTFHARP